MQLQNTVQASWAEEKLHLDVEQGCSDAQPHRISSRSSFGTDSMLSGTVIGFK